MNSISLNDTGSNSKLFPLVISFLITEILGWDLNFTIARWTGSEIFMYSSYIIKEFPVMSKLETLFIKNSYNFSLISLSLCETSFSTSLLLAP